MIPSVALTVVSAIFPPTAEIDFTSLPPKGTFENYFLNVKVVLSDKSEIKFHSIISKDGDPAADARTSVLAALKLSGCDAEKEGDYKIRLAGRKKTHVTKVELDSPNVEPTVRWIPKVPKK